jgi:hypothetical protein
MFAREKRPIKGRGKSEEKLQYFWNPILIIIIIINNNNNLSKKYYENFTGPEQYGMYMNFSRIPAPDCDLKYYSTTTGRWDRRTFYGLTSRAIRAEFRNRSSQDSNRRSLLQRGSKNESIRQAGRQRTITLTHNAN